MLLAPNGEVGALKIALLANTVHVAHHGVLCEAP